MYLSAPPAWPALQAQAFLPRARRLRKAPPRRVPLQQTSLQQAPIQQAPPKRASRL